MPTPHPILSTLPLTALALWAATSTSAPDQPQPHQPDPLATELNRRLTEDVRPLLQQNCFRCHGHQKQKAGLRLDQADSLQAVLEAAGDWEFVREMITTGQMPPDDQPRPTEHEVLTIAQWIDDALAYQPLDAKPDPGWFTIHRLNKAEYRGTMRDLLGIDPAQTDLAAGLPPDDTGYGFDNIADVLTMSPLQLERYLDAADRALDLALGQPVTINAEPKPLRDLKITANGNGLRQGGFYLYSRGSVIGEFDAPATAEYEITITAWGTPGGDAEPHLDVRTDGKHLGAFDVPARRDDPQDYSLRTTLDRGRHRIYATFTNDYYVKDVADRNLAIEAISVAGPLSEIRRPDAFNQVFFETPPDHASHETQREIATRIIDRFATRAFRRPLTPDELAQLTTLYDASREAGDAFEQSVRVALTATLVSPNFLYRYVTKDVPNEDGVYTLDDFELASRLSYFLWSSMPDDELMQLAHQGALTGALASDQTLRTQVRRMLADPKSDAFITNFAGQWLLLRNLAGFQVDASLYADFDEDLRSAMISEATLFFEDIVRADRSVLDLLSSNHPFLNERLANLYGIPGVKGDVLRRVELPQDSPRGGVLTMGAVLTVTSNPTRTSPVKRGLYVLDQLLGTPPPPPPPDIAPLEEAKVVGENPTLRDQLAAHLTNPTCAACHSRMDPIGLALENFNAIGAWRDTEGGRPIDASGVLPGGVDFVGPNQLKQILLARDDLFVENLSKKILTYALGRGIEPFDRPTIRQITEHVRDSDDRFQSLIEAVVLSDAFRTCRDRD